MSLAYPQILTKIFKKIILWLRYTNWCHPEILDCLPLPLPPPQLLWKKDYKADDEMKHEAMDSFTEYYQPLRLTLFEEDYCCNMPRTRG